MDVAAERKELVEVLRQAFRDCRDDIPGLYFDDYNDGDEVCLDGMTSLSKLADTIISAGWVRPVMCDGERANRDHPGMDLFMLCQDSNCSRCRPKRHTA